MPCEPYYRKYWYTVKTLSKITGLSEPNIRKKISLGEVNLNSLTSVIDFVYYYRLQRKIKGKDNNEQNM